MRINITRLGLILLILGVIMLFNLWTAPVIQSYKTQIMTVDPGVTFAYGLFVAPVGLGNVVVESDTMVPGVPTAEELANPNADGSISVAAPATPEEYEAYVRLVVVSPSNVTLVDKQEATPFSVPIDFTERGEYVLYVTNLGNATVPIPVSVKFPPNAGVVYREADKFLVSILLTTSGVAFLCIGLVTTLITKHKNTVSSKSTRW
ncbi:MAG: hypothetical protein FWB84_06615 [Candidatus Bathyarchaeota archaeon]|uniref:hypothetical protein n=1 Tax=Candidatus Bathycorpusculum sp. TaxID=2994959 RepID=UPI00281ACC40|nr:hypothetical protein [Candidatus Termiticorpusculum sp.]MCL2257965.1 hypothetical protein [Candidatus Termiticorpusculum sp.]MCL2291653.1 hypothetical protein [Candidatus Termiticorpusculum sp.]